MTRLVYRPEAEAYVRAAFRWYEHQREGLGAEFLDELAKAEDKVRATPLAFRILRRDAGDSCYAGSVSAYLSRDRRCGRLLGLLPWATFTASLGGADVMATLFAATGNFHRWGTSWVRPESVTFRQTTEARRSMGLCSPGSPPQGSPTAGVVGDRDAGEIRASSSMRLRVLASRHSFSI